MPIFWNDIEILQVIDESERENSIAVSSGMSLMQAAAARRDTTAGIEDYGPFALGGCEAVQLRPTPRRR